MELVTNSNRAEQVVAGKDGEIQKIGHTIFVQIAANEGSEATIILAHRNAHVTNGEAVIGVVASGLADTVCQGRVVGVGFGHIVVNGNDGNGLRRVPVGGGIADESLQALQAQPAGFYGKTL